MKDLAAAFLACLLLGALWLFLAWHKSQNKTQPIAYNHKKHVGELGLECSHCHAGIGEGKARAGLPPLDICLGCHNADDANPKSKPIQDYAARNKPIPWQRVYRVPKHVYFSHRRHVGTAKLDCALCHGDISNMEQPVTRQAVSLDMGRCLACHKRKGVTNDCLSCHR